MTCWKTEHELRHHYVCSELLFQVWRQHQSRSVLTDTQECLKLLICWFNPDSKMLHVLDYSEPAGLYRRNICTFLLIIRLNSASLMFLESGLLTFNCYTWRHVGKPAQTRGQHVAQFTHFLTEWNCDPQQNLSNLDADQFSHTHSEQKLNHQCWMLEVDCPCSLGN